MCRGTLAGNPTLEDRPRRSLENELAQLDEGTETRREIADYLAAVKDRLEYRSEVLETVAIDLSKPATGLTGYDRWRAEIDRLAETGQVSWAAMIPTPPISTASRSAWSTCAGRSPISVG